MDKVRELDRTLADVELDLLRRKASEDQPPDDTSVEPEPDDDE